ncbi:hypothetical protein [Paraburkholderia rhynchosiae]|uniref:DUF4398 domain-containing protein n=1 Tax=Paraburkholderia rhynchosiae TaxID=487049 RepID=A0A2N7WWZ5_9BURK|nr:hypothetical protein [Paraburkholderia rhynchosiae]PMS34026.1 hypothetical protein C0Z16_00180 [Paraburkholderia rhynchosiae]CAB3636047.1 hypothetical protein LMG27174_00034 [Paraburkholderia rhynchosiae]
MKKIFSTLLFCAATASSACWAQTDAASSASGDQIVQMHQRISAANRTYDAKVAAAKRVYLRQKAAAAKERDASVAAARDGVPSAENQ